MQIAAHTLTDELSADLAKVDEAIASSVASAAPIPWQIMTDFLAAGGKRLRPMLVLLAARAAMGCVNEQQLISIAACTELLHMASLLHDDVVDEADTRRGMPSVNARWGNHLAILCGDYLWAQASILLSREGNPRIFHVISEAASLMISGQIQEWETMQHLDPDQTQYWEIVQQKTASFLSACCRLGAILAGAPPEIEQALASYGINLGTAFQITDDLLDVTADPAQTGKPRGNDLREGKMTLPILLALKQVSGDEQVALRSLLARKEMLTAQEIDDIYTLLTHCGAIEETRKTAQRFIDQAIDNLVSLLPSDARTTLQQLTQQLVSRNS